MLAGMSDDLYFQVFYGSGEVRYGPEGVDLSEFSSITKKYSELERGLGFQYPIGYFGCELQGSLHGRDEGLSRGAHFCWVSSTVTALFIRALSRR